MVLNPQPIVSPLPVNERYILLSTLSSINCNLLKNTDFALRQTLLFGNFSFDSNKNFEILLIINYQLRDFMRPSLK